MVVIGTPVTTRKRFSFVYSPLGEIHWSDRDAGSCFDWLANHDIWCYDVDTGHQMLTVNARKKLEPRSLYPWQKLPPRS